MKKDDNQRQFNRSDCFVPVDGRCGGVFDHTKTVDISKRGAGLISDHPIPVGNKIPIELDFEENDEPVLVIGKVMYSKKIPKNGFYRVGIKFIDILRGSKGRLDNQFKRQSVKRWL